jgi:hypothetical protein
MTGRICYLHVGTGKTGSSAIQYALTAERHTLLERGYFYPNATGNFHAVLAGKPTTGNAGGIYSALKRRHAASAFERIRSLSRHEEHLVLSCEGFSNCSAASLNGLAAQIRELGYRTKCLVFFRPQADVIVSSYLQQVKANRLEPRITLDDYARQQLARPSRRWNWLARAEKLEAAFGDLTVKWYPSVVQNGPEAVPNAAFAWLGVERGGAGSAPIINPTPGREALVVLREANARGFGGKRFADALLTRAHRLGKLGSRVSLEPSLREEIEEATRESNAALLERYCPDLSVSDALNLRKPPQVSDLPLDNELVERLTEIAETAAGTPRTIAAILDRTGFKPGSAHAVAGRIRPISNLRWLVPKPKRVGAPARRSASGERQRRARHHRDVN